MAGENREETAYLETEMIKKGHTFSFFQIIRLLNCLVAEKQSRTENSIKASDLRIRPNLSLGFPKSDVEAVTKGERYYTLTANLPGLYGTASPLPTFYTEELLSDESQGESTARTFYDVINQRLYELLFAGWSKYRGMQQVFETKNNAHIQRLFSLIGLGEDALRENVHNPYRLLRYTGLLASGPRSASGLETIIEDLLGGIPVTVIQAVEKKGEIPESQRGYLGENICLGRNSQLGSENRNRTGAFRIEIGPVKAGEYDSLIPGTELYSALIELTDFYISQPLDYDIDVVLDPEEKPGTACLGAENWSSLGHNTWVYSASGPEEFRSRFHPEKAA